jgi:hypothetical protein
MHRRPVAVIKFSAKADFPDRAPPMTQAFFHICGETIDPVTD